jgi:hypothetical protein
VREQGKGWVPGPLSGTAPAEESDEPRIAEHTLERSRDVRLEKGRDDHRPDHDGEKPAKNRAQSGIFRFPDQPLNRSISFFKSPVIAESWAATIVR